MPFNPDQFLNLKIGEWEPPLEFEPDVTPVSMLDVDRMSPMSMEHRMSDPCPACGAFNMRVGDYVCFGVCTHCSGG